MQQTILYGMPREAPRVRNIQREPLRSSSEVVKIFGFKDVKTLWNYIRNKSFPNPDIYISRVNNKTTMRGYWKLSTINKELKRRKEITV
jgi:hypothetical protein